MCTKNGNFQPKWKIDLMVVVIFIDREESPICVHWHQYFFLKYNLYYFVLIKILDMPQAYLKLTSNVCGSNASDNPIENQWAYSIWTHWFVCVCLCWCMNKCDKGVEEGLQSNTSKRNSMESHVETPSHKVISLPALSSLSLCACCTVIRLIKAT